MNSARRNKKMGTSLLIGDIGGTNARFALADTGKPGFSNALTLQIILDEQLRSGWGEQSGAEGAV